MKKSVFLTLMLITAMIFTFSGCGEDKDSGSSSSSAETIQEELSADPDSGDDGESEAPEGTESQTPDEDSSSSAGASGSSGGTPAGSSQNAGSAGGSSGSGKDTSSNQGGGQSSASGGSSGGSNSSTPPQASGGGSSTEEPSAAKARSYIGKSASSLISGIGSPTSSQYSPSCMGDGDDGELYYGDFTVYTYREGDSEKVVDVE